MKSRYALLAVSAVIVSSLILTSFPAYAQCLDEIAEGYKKETRLAEITMLEAKQVLLDTDPAEWMPFQIQAYEYYSLWVVYAATASYIASNEFRGHPADLTDLVTEGYIIYWPENPYNDWKPVEILEYSDGFSPGNIAVQWAPSGYRDGRFPNSFEVVIYGPDMEFASYGSIERFELQVDWPTIPEGALYLLGFG